MKEPRTLIEKSKRLDMAIRLKKLRMKVWSDMFDRKSLIDSTEYRMYEDICLIMSDLINNLSEGESDEEND